MTQNTKALATFFDADEKRMNFLKAILPIYVQELNKAVVQMKNAYQAKDTDAFLAIIHKMKGSALTFGAKPISSECILIEDKYELIKDITEIDIEVLLVAVEELNEIYSEDEGY